MPSKKPISITAATITLSRNVNAGGAVNVLNAPGGCTVTLPTATGSGDEYELVVGTALTTSNYVVQVGNTLDVLAGSAYMSSATASGSNHFPCTATDDTLTMTGTTKGGLRGSRIVIKDVATNIFQITANLAASGTAITPFSAAV